MGLEKQIIPMRTSRNRPDIAKEGPGGRMVWTMSRIGTQRLQIKRKPDEVARYSKIDVTCGMDGLL